MKYPQWVANIVPVAKKDEKVRMCVNQRDLNKASPKDDFPLPHIDVLLDNTTQFFVLFFMDGFSGYNKIKMSLEDRKDHIHYALGHLLLQSDAPQIKECWGNISKGYGKYIP